VSERRAQGVRNLVWMCYGNYVSMVFVPSLGTHICKQGIYVRVYESGWYKCCGHVLMFMLFTVTGCIVYCASKFRTANCNRVLCVLGASCSSQFSRIQYTEV
jgi:hypothetical protein